jgi:hypothetical protein
MLTKGKGRYKLPVSCTYAVVEIMACIIMLLHYHADDGRRVVGDLNYFIMGPGERKFYGASRGFRTHYSFIAKKSPPEFLFLIFPVCWRHARSSRVVAQNLYAS